MPISRDPAFEPEAEPQMDLRMMEFVERRREEQARARRQRIQLSAIIVLGLVAIVLAVSNAVLVSRLASRPVAPPLARSAERPADPSTPVERERPPEPAPSRERVTTEERATSEGRTLSEAPPPSETRALAEERALSDERASVDARPPREPALPARTTPPAATEREARAGATRPAPEVPAAVRSRESSGGREDAEADLDSAGRTARWLVRTYGPLEAETRARTAADFYAGEQRAFWRRVLSHVRAAR